MVIYQISKVYLALMYMQHKNMVYIILHIYPRLVLDQNANYHAYSTPLCHEVWNVDHKIIILGIKLCYNTYSHIGVQQQHYPEYDTVCMSIFFSWVIFCIFLDQWHHLCGNCLSDVVIIPELNVHHLFGCECAFAYVNQICFIQGVEQWTSIDICSTYQHHWVNLSLLFHSQVHLCLYQLLWSNNETQLK